MPLVIPDGCVQAALPFNYGAGSLYAYVTQGLYDFNAELSPLETLDIWVDAFLDNVAPQIDGGCSIGPAIGTVQSAGGDYFTFPGVSAGAGGREDADSTSAAVSVIVNKVTGRLGRTGRGRYFLPWALDRDDLNEDGSIDSTALSNLNTALMSMAGDMTTAGVAPVILHNAGVPGGTEPTPITAFVCQSVAGTQRRRQRR